MIEDSKTEFKRELNDKFENEVVGFLNSSGGHIYIGLNDDGTVFGVAELDKIQIEIKNRLKDHISPSPIGFFEIVREEIDGKTILHIIIAEGSEKPYYIRKYGMSPSGCYIRVGSSCIQMSEKQILAQFSKRTRTSLTNILSPNQSLTFQQLRIYYEEKGYKFTDSTFHQLNFYTNDSFNYLAYLLSDQNALVINLGKFKGNDVVDLEEMQSYSNQSLIKTTYEILDKIESYNKTFTKITDSSREERKLFDPIAVREAVVNAIVHGDYTYENTPTFRIFDDHLEIISVGGLPEGIEQKEFLSGYMSPKNPALMKIFRDLGLVEHMGTGIIRILSKYPTSVFIFSNNFIKVSIPFANEGVKPQQISNISNENSQKEITTRQEEILNLLKENNNITQIEIANKLGVSRYTIIRDMADMKKKGIIGK